MISPLLRLLSIAAFLLGTSALSPSRPQAYPPGFLTIVNQREHSVMLLDLSTRSTLANIDVGVNGHELAVSPDGKFAYVPIYGNAGVGMPGTDGRTIDIIDLHNRTLAGQIDLGEPVRPHCAKFGPDGLLYVSAELANAIYVVDTAAQKLIAEIPTGQPQSHMLVISPDGRRAYTANVESGTVSDLDLQKRSLITVIPVAKKIQRISISPDGRRVFTHDQDQSRIAIIDTATDTVAGFIAVPNTVYSSAVTPDGETLVANAPAGKIFVIDLAQSKVNASIEVPPSAGQIIVAPDGSRAFLSCPQAGSIQILDLQSGKLAAAIPLSKGVDGLAWLPSL
jgi:DNA-binding beta-propeller fold protein YncE